jgi:hypothetical protein
LFGDAPCGQEQEENGEVFHARIFAVGEGSATA